MSNILPCVEWATPAWVLTLLYFCSFFVLQSQARSNASGNIKKQQRHGAGCTRTSARQAAGRQTVQACEIVAVEKERENSLTCGQRAKILFAKSRNEG